MKNEELKELVRTLQGAINNARSVVELGLPTKNDTMKRVVEAAEKLEAAIYSNETLEDKIGKLPEVVTDTDRSKYYLSIYKCGEYWCIDYVDRQFAYTSVAKSSLNDAVDEMLVDLENFKMEDGLSF